MQYLFIAQLLIMMLGPLVKMLFRIIGFGFVSYIGSNLIIDQAKNYMVSNMGVLGSEISGILGIANIDIAINMYFAAIATRFILAGIDKATDRSRNQVWRPPGRDYIDA